MEQLLPIIQTLSRYKLKQIDVLDDKNSKSRYTQLYRLLQSGEITTDEAAARHFYGAGASPRDPRFRTFKKEFKDRLLNTLFFIDYEGPQFSDFQRAHYFAIRELGALRILYARYLGAVAYPMAENLLRIAQKFELTDVCLLALEKLKNYYALDAKNAKKYEAARQAFWEYKALWDAELLAREALDDLRLERSKSSAYKSEHIPLVREKLAPLITLREKHDSVLFCYPYYLIREIECSTLRDYAGKIALCDEAVAYFQTKPFEVRGFTATFFIAKALAQLALRRYEECKGTLTDALAKVEKGNAKWFGAMEIKVILGFHNENYALAYDAFAEARAHKAFDRLKGAAAEIWKLFEAWLYWAFALGKIAGGEAGGPPKALARFRYARFVNDLPVFSADKKGMNLQALFAQIALSVALPDQREKLFHAAEGVRKYMARNAPAGDAVLFRASQFAKLLLEIPKADFNAAELRRAAAPVLKTLSEMPADFVDAGYRIEIIPYEVLWKELAAALI